MYGCMAARSMSMAYFVLGLTHNVSYDDLLSTIPILGHGTSRRSQGQPLGPGPRDHPRDYFTNLVSLHPSPLLPSPPPLLVRNKCT